MSSAKRPALDPQEVDEVILGCGQPHGPAGHNIARVAALRAGLPVTTAGVTVNRYCNSGLQAIVQAAHMVHARRRRRGHRRRRRVDHHDGARQLARTHGSQEHLPGLYMAMGETAEVVARRYNITREAQDEYALVSQQRTARGQQEGFFDGELAPMQVHARDARQEDRRKIGEEEVPASIATSAIARTRRSKGCGSCRRSSTRQAGTGSVTAGNSSQLSDGASATLVMSSERAKALGITPRLIFRGYAVAGCEPDEMGIGPVFAVPKLLKKHGLRVDDIDVWELNEAFASQVVYCRDRLGIPMERLNLNGGSIAIGHPFGMTGSRLVGTIMNEMARRRARYGVVTMCVGGGQGAAALFERA